MRGDVKILPSLPVSAFSDFTTFTIRCERVDIDGLKRLAEAVCYIRHKPTIDLLASIIERGETFYVVGLSRRAPIGQDIEVRPDDLVILKCRIE